MQNLSKQERAEELEGLYDFAEGQGIKVYEYDMPKYGAMSIMDEKGRCFIGIDKEKKSKSEQKTMLLHELGHCLTGAFYNMYTPFCLRTKCERRANEWAIENYLPYDRLIDAYKSGISTDYELAQYFEVSEQFVRMAKEYYLQKR